MKKNSNQQKAIDLAQRIWSLKNIRTSDAFQVSILKLFERGSDNSDQICRCIIEAMAVYENSPTYRKKIGSNAADAKAVLKSLLSLYTFFKEIDDGKLEANLHILQLTDGRCSANDIIRLEKHYFSEYRNHQEDNPPF